ncbi:helix-turn-helix domain-containing protein [Bradyrhizobium sp. P5_C11_2]
MPSEFVSVAAAARMLGIAPNTMRRVIAAGHVPAFKIADRAVKIRRADVEVYLAECVAKSAARRAA